MANSNSKNTNNNTNKSNFNSVLNRDSRYVQGGTTNVYSNRLGWWERTTFTYDVSDLYVLITKDYAHRPDRVAYDFYGKTSLMWLVLQYNNIVDPATEFVEGKQIRLPAPSRVTREITTQRTGGVSATT